MNKTRLKYEKPAMQVYELKKTSRLLAGSPDGDLGDPNDPEESTWS